MATTYSITEAQANFPAVVREAAEQPIVITRRDKVVGYLLSPERFEAILETMEVLANSEAMQAIRDAEAGKTKYYPLSILDESSDED
jgi:prevent-host-death family protein